MEDIGVGTRVVLVGRATGLQFCCQNIDTSKAFDELMETKGIITISAYANHLASSRIAYIFATMSLK